MKNRVNRRFVTQLAGLVAFSFVIAGCGKIDPEKLEGYWANEESSISGEGIENGDSMTGDVLVFKMGKVQTLQGSGVVLSVGSPTPYRVDGNKLIVAGGNTALFGGKGVTIESLNDEELELKSEFMTLEYKAKYRRISAQEAKAMTGRQ